MKKLLRVIAIIAILGVAYGTFYIQSLLPIITGYPAKYLASAVFISHRDQAEVEAKDLNFSFIKYVNSSVDFEAKKVTSRFLWGKSEAIYREGFGCTLLRDTDEAALRAVKFPKIEQVNYSQDTTNWPLGNLIADTLFNPDNYSQTRQVIEELVSDTTFGGDAFAAVVLHNGVPVAEEYDAIFSENTRFLSWSMAKSFTGTLAGIMAQQGELGLDETHLLPEWEKDQRQFISLRNIMQMSSGLHWNEDYGNRSDVTLMLYCEADCAAFAYNQKMDYPVNSTYYYSSGSTNIVNYIIRQKIANEAQYYAFPKVALFDKIGMPNAIFEVDASGTHVGSSYIYATARDYARYALLYLQEGNFGGEQIISKQWVEETKTPALASKGGYGLFFWLNENGQIPTLPRDAYSCNGHDGQRIFIVPSLDLAVVILGYSPNHAMDFNAFFEQLIPTLPQL